MVCQGVVVPVASYANIIRCTKHNQMHRLLKSPEEMTWLFRWVREGFLEEAMSVLGF